MTILTVGNVIRSKKDLIALAKKAEAGKTMKLEALLQRIDHLAVLGDLKNAAEITSIVWHHREVVPGSIYCCLPGTHFDGHDFARLAMARGAVAFICEHSVLPNISSAKENYGAAIYTENPIDLENGAYCDGADQARVTDFSPVQIIVERGKARIAMAQAACAFYNDPSQSMLTVGVTGTNGKTTTTFILKSILEAAGIPTGVIGTLDGARTTPESPELQKALATYKEAGYKACVMEVTSHALAQNRVYGMHFDVAIFTNLSQDHLDYHGSMEDYFQAKAKLFSENLSKAGVVNADDRYGRQLIESAGIETVSYSITDAKELEIGPAITTFIFDGYRVRLALGGAFNVENALAAATTAKVIGISTKDIVAGISAAYAVPGRFEQIEADNGVRIVVDFAHTPDALQKVLIAAGTTLKDAEALLTVVFGCGGDRDKGKRPIMGQIASMYADRIILTSDNPRTEDPIAIIDQILAGINTSSKVELVVEPDRAKAIRLALQTSKQGDLVLIAGKGHESTQQIGDKVFPCDDRKTVSEFLAMTADPFAEPVVWPSSTLAFGRQQRESFYNLADGFGQKDGNR
jgi:UDP-N-acetylmuramoyl-L-alanyl-D-glutamate--2,6-diaminopimelate ligase